MCCFPVNLNSEISVFFNFDGTLQEGQGVFFYIFACEFNIFISFVEVG